MDQDRRHPLLGLAGGVGEPGADLAEAQAGLVAPVAEPARARVVDAEQRGCRRAPRSPRRRAWSSRGRRGSRCTNEPWSWLPATPYRSRSSNAVFTRVQAERLPALAGRGVVAGVEDRGRAARVGDRAGDRGPCRCCRAGRRRARRRSRPPRARAARGRRRRRARCRRTRGSCRRCRPRSRSAAGSATSSRRCGPRRRRPARAPARPGRGSPAARSTVVRDETVGSRPRHGCQHEHGEHDAAPARRRRPAGRPDAGQRARGAGPARAASQIATGTRPRHGAAQRRGGRHRRRSSAGPWRSVPRAGWRCRRTAGPAPGWRSRWSCRA